MRYHIICRRNAKNIISFFCNAQAMSPQEENSEAMMKSLQNHVETVKGTEAMPVSPVCTLQTL
jgi:hypothetical protein